MDGYIFYWISWILWIIITFIMVKDNYRTYLALWLLTLIALSNSEVVIGVTKINAAIFILFFGALILLSKTSNWILNIIRSLCLVFGYVGVLFWEQISPVWLVIPRLIMIPVIGFIFLSFLTNENVDKLAVWCLGITTGEVLHSLILNSYGFNEYIGDMAYFDLLFTAIGLIVMVTFLQDVRSRLDQMIGAIEKQKKRWT
ncbi:YphA family membrane protein [Aquibacillus saliphilus]|uniref:YphA family membrane protein n=1 Tax=Aquibacillus saliphilus TaxID=1909422 RepID=UPI001CEFBDDB|nr:hypothetical protein [Aquibacillus saliphilus]